MKRGDWVIYSKQKLSASPGPRAHDVVPSAKGETYNYIVDKYWIVQDVLPDGQIRVRTRSGKEHIIAPDDPRLRRARWWECWLFGERFRAVEQQCENAQGTS